MTDFGAVFRTCVPLSCKDFFFFLREKEVTQGVFRKKFLVNAAELSR